MKLSIIILAALFSSFTKTPEPTPSSICGTWKGYYGTEKEIYSLLIKIDPQNKAEIIFNGNNSFLKTRATYKLVSDSKIIISSTFPGQNSFAIILHGNLNRTSSFIDGQWDGKENEGGCFYLQKQFQPAVTKL